MNREIKFRAWDNKINEFIRYNVLCFTDEGFGYAKPLSRDYMSNPDNLEIMQYTGLKDKNNKEIYEGDIMNCICMQDWNLEWWNSDNKSKNIVIEDIRNMPFDEEDRYCFIVVGNIYENKDLLKQKEQSTI